MKEKIYGGFSIAEVVISIFVISVGLVAVVNLIAASIRDSMSSRDLIVASQLSQEGVEIVRNIRDNDLNFFFATADDSYRVDKDSSALDAAGDNKLYYKNNYYVHNTTGSATKFSRKIIISDTTVANQKRVESVVVWNRSDFPPSCSAVTRCVSTETLLTQW